MHDRTSVSRLKVVFLALVVAFGSSLVAATGAEAVALSQTVTTNEHAGLVSWATPRVAKRHAEIVSSSESKTASSVIRLEDSSAPTSYDFKVSVPKGAVLATQADGSAVVTGADGQPLGSFLPPWAKDAQGKMLPTSYVVTWTSETRYLLTQLINTDGAVFPVTADPKWTTGWVTGTLYFNKRETSNIATGSATMIGGVCAASGALGGPVLIGACLIGAGQAVYTATSAKNAGRCLKLKMSIVGPPVCLGAYSYSGGYCT